MSSRLPSNWRDRLPPPASIYRTKLSNLGKPDETGWSSAKCPFHDDQGQALLVDIAGARGGWRCDICGVQGDLIAFVQRLENLNFPAAVRVLMDLAGRSQPSKNAAAHIQRCRALLAGDR